MNFTSDDARKALERKLASLQREYNHVVTDRLSAETLWLRQQTVWRLLTEIRQVEEALAE